MSDSENEEEVFTITSAEGLEYDSTETIAGLIFQVHHLVHGKKRDLVMLRSLTEDIRSLLSSNEDARVSDTLGDLDLPAGWSTDAEDEGEDE